MPDWDSLLAFIPKRIPLATTKSGAIRTYTLWQIWDLLIKPSMVAVGEIGLDFVTENRVVCEAQLKLLSQSSGRHSHTAGAVYLFQEFFSNFLFSLIWPLEFQFSKVVSIWIIDCLFTLFVLFWCPCQTVSMNLKHIWVEVSKVLVIVFISADSGIPTMWSSSVYCYDIFAYLVLQATSGNSIINHHVKTALRLSYVLMP